VVEYLRVFCHVGFFLAFGSVAQSRRTVKMLVLSRKLGESIVIDGAIKVQVIEVKGNVVRLGIEAPIEISIHRSELYERFRANETAFAAAKEKS
jgi:carbon storage regulator